MGASVRPAGSAQYDHYARHAGAGMTILRPGDTLYFLGGDYHISGSTDPGFWGNQLICPAVSGTATQPITLEAEPGQTVRIFLDAGSQPVFGTEAPALSYVRFLGFTIEPTDAYTSGGSLEVASPFRISGTGNEVAYCEIIGQYVATTDNHDGIRLDSANSALIHNNIIHGVMGGSYNSAGIKVYKSTHIVSEDNYIYGNTVGIFDKDGGSLGNGTNQNTYTRNYITGNTNFAFLGNNQDDTAIYYMYDNVFEGTLNLGGPTSNCQIYNNLILTTTQPFQGQGDLNQELWNNIVISGGQAITAYVDHYVSFTTSGSQAPLQYMDYNVYDGAPTYSFGEYTSQYNDFSLSQMQAQGFEQHAHVVSSDLSIFQDVTSYALLPQWTTAGRYGDPVGPRYPVAQILNTNRYGPGALN